LTGAAFVFAGGGTDAYGIAATHAVRVIVDSDVVKGGAA
jgi:hypothetical protein